MTTVHNSALAAVCILLVLLVVRCSADDDIRRCRTNNDCAAYKFCDRAMASICEYCQVPCKDFNAYNPKSACRKNCDDYYQKYMALVTEVTTPTAHQSTEAIVEPNSNHSTIVIVICVTITILIIVIVLLLLGIYILHRNGDEAKRGPPGQIEEGNLYEEVGECQELGSFIHQETERNLLSPVVTNTS